MSELESPRTTRTALAALLLGAVFGLAVAFLSPLGAALSLAGVGCGVAIFLWPELGLLVFVAIANLLPFAVIPVRLAGFNFTLVDATLTALLAAWVFRAVFRGRPLVGSSLDGLVLLYLGLAATSFLLGLTYSITPERGRLFLKSVNSALLFFSVLNCVRSTTSLRRVVVTLLLAGPAAAVIAIFIHMLPEATALQVLSTLGPLGYPTGPQVLRPIADTKILRAIGTSIDPNVLGGLMMMASLMILAQIFSARPLLRRGLLWPMLATTTVALLLTQSRSALGGLVLGAALVGSLRDRRLLAAMAVAAVAAPFLPGAGPFVGRLASGLSFQDRAAAMRLDEYANAVETILRYPWFGIGFGEPPTIDLYLGVSSIYLLIGQEMGLLGLASFLALLGTLASQVTGGLGAVRDEELRGILLGLATALAGGTAAGLLDHYFVNIVFPHMVGLFWLYVGLAVVAARLAKETGGP